MFTVQLYQTSIYTYCICATNHYFQVLGNIHDIESYTIIDNSLNLNNILFTSHWAHLSVIFTWCASAVYHIGWQGNYEFYISNPVKTIFIIHSIFDPHLSSYDPESDVTYSGLYNLFITLGYLTTLEIYKIIILLQLLALFSTILVLIHSTYIDALIFYMLPNLVIPNTKPYNTGLNSSVIIANVHSYPELRLFIVTYDITQIRLNYHINSLIGLSSLLWSGHLIHQAIPVSKGIINHSFIYLQSHLNILYTGDYSSLAFSSDSDNHVWLSNLGAGSSILTFASGLKPDSNSLFLTDIAHHHLAIGVLLIIGSHLYSSLYYGYGHKLQYLAASNGNNNIIYTKISNIHIRQ